MIVTDLLPLFLDDDKSLYTLIDIQGDSVIYIGQSFNQAPLETDEVFLLKRLAIVNGIFKIETANGGKTDKAFSARADEFPPLENLIDDDDSPRVNDDGSNTEIS